MSLRSVASGVSVLPHLVELLLPLVRLVVRLLRMVTWWPNSDFLISISVLPGDHLWPYKSNFEEALARQSGKEPSRVLIHCQTVRTTGNESCQIISNQLLSLSQLWRPTRRIQRALLTPRRKFTHYRLDLWTGNSYEIYCIRSQRYSLRILRQQCRYMQIRNG